MDSLAKEILLALDGEPIIAATSRLAREEIAARIADKIRPSVHVRDECEIVGWQVRAKAKGGRNHDHGWGAWGPVISRPFRGLIHDPSVQMIEVFRPPITPP